MRGERSFCSLVKGGNFVFHDNIRWAPGNILNCIALLHCSCVLWSGTGAL
jgi:hypothetical protein